MGDYKMIYNCTKNLLTALKVNPMEKPTIFNELFSWNVKLVKMGRRNLIYMMNDVTKLSVILYGVTAKEFKSFDQVMKEAIEEVLKDCQLPQQTINHYMEDLGEPIFTTSGTRKQLGVLNRAAMEVTYFFADLYSDQILQNGLCAHQNGSIIKNDKGDYVTPKEIMKNLVERTYTTTPVHYNLEKIATHMFAEDRLDRVYFLNIKDGTISLADRGTELSDTLDADEDYNYIRSGHTDFFSTFHQFADEVNNPLFQKDLERFGHGSGAVERIKNQLKNYPFIEKQWYNYSDTLQQKNAQDWLESIGLM